MTPINPIRAALEIVAAEADKRGEAGDLARRLHPLLQQAAEREETRSSRRDVGEIVYSVERSAEGETLVERRMSGKSKPFRCPKAVYDVMVVLLAAGRPLSVDDIISGAESVLGYRPADFQIRVPLRLWLYRQPAVVVRNRARYSASASKEMPKTATALWKKLSM